MIGEHPYDLPCTLLYEGLSLEGVLIGEGGELTRHFIMKRPIDVSFWSTLPKVKLDCNVVVKDVSYKASFIVTKSSPIYTAVSTKPPLEITSITGKITDESFKLI